MRCVLFPVIMPACTAQSLLAQEDIERKGDQSERGAAAAEDDAATGHMCIHHAHHRGERREEQEKGDKAAENGACPCGAGAVLFLEDGHSGNEASASGREVQLAFCKAGS